MSARILLLTPARRFIANRYGVGYQIPLGMVLLGGPLIDAGHTVKLIDNDLYGWSQRRLGEEVQRFNPDYILIGHTGSTAAHQICLESGSTLKMLIPYAKVIYGGVYPTYAAEESLRACSAIDVVVCGEGEMTIVDLIDALEWGEPLAEVPGIVWRDRGQPVRNRRQSPIADLDLYRPGWELVDWDGYQLYGVGRSAGVQFSRGCPLTCTYCGQWMFWKRWRHRSSENMVAQLRTLKEEYGVKIVWFADENFGADREVAKELLQLIIEADLGLSLNVNMTAADVVRDGDLLPLYKAAGIEYVVMGIESLEDGVIDEIRKNNPYQISYEAVRLLRRNGMVSFANIIYGLEDESLGTMMQKFNKIRALDPDILNACYLTPHFWTKDGRDTDPADVIQTELSKWTYRNQVIRTPHLSPAALFFGVKLTETLFHLRPKALWRLLTWADRRVRRILRRTVTSGAGVVLAEIGEFLFWTRFASRGAMQRLPGMVKKEMRI